MLVGLAMNDTHPIIDLSSTLLGTDLLLKNAFRLAQLPVDASHSQLKKRQQVLEMAQKMSMPVPKGICAIFAHQDEDSDSLREALHRMQDPLNRLLDELFWFWPNQFGQSHDDKGLILLANEDVKQSVKTWVQGEGDTQNYVSTHNLAVLHLLQAAEMELVARSNGNIRSISKSSRKLWKSAFERWRLLSEQEAFWGYLKERVRAIDDPRLPERVVDVLRQQLVHILFSVNVSLMMQAAGAQDSHYILHHKRVMKESGFPSTVVDEVVDKFTKSHREKIRHICQDATENSNRDPKHGNQHAMQVIQHAESILQILQYVNGADDKTFILQSDQVAETVLHCQIKFGNKTEDWPVSLRLLEKARPFAIGEAAKSRIDDNIKSVKEIHASGNIWCLSGYFDLPEAVLTLLEEARTNVDGDRHEKALEILRDLLLGCREIPFDPVNHKFVLHCIAYCLKDQSISEYNRALAEYNSKSREAVWDSFTQESASVAYLSYKQYQNGEGHGTIFCASCRHLIVDQFSIRTINDLEVPFCPTCNKKINEKFDRAQKALNVGIKSSLDAMVLANHFSPNFKPIVKNIEAIRKSASEEGISEENAEKLKLKWDLHTVDERVNVVLAKLNGTFGSLKKVVSRQSSAAQEYTLNCLFTALSSNPKLVPSFLECIMGDAYFMDNFLTEVGQRRKVFSNENAYRACVYLLGVADDRVHALAKEKLREELNQAFPQILRACGTENSVQQEMLTELLSYAGQNPEFTAIPEPRLLLNALFAAHSEQLSQILLELNESLNPEFHELCRSRSSIRALKYLEQHGQPIQRQIASTMLEKERSRGFWGRFNVWQWRPAKTFSIVASEEQPWWNCSSNGNASAPNAKQLGSGSGTGLISATQEPAAVIAKAGDTEEAKGHANPVGTKDPKMGIQAEYSEIAKLRAEYPSADSPRKREIVKIFQRHGWGNPA
jgi:hypothetical protein